MTSNISMTCSDCGESLDPAVHGVGEKLPCPNCGSLKKTIGLSIVEDAGISIKEALRGKVKDVTKPAKSKLRQDFFIGDDLHRSSGKWNKKERYINKDEDTYKEVVIDPTTGEIIHHCEEPLSQHQGHGDAKPKPEDDQISE